MERSLIEFIHRTAILFTQHTHADDEELMSIMCTDGVEKKYAKYLVAFIPLAFVRVLLDTQGPTFQPTYQHHNSVTGTYASIPLREQPVYQAAYDVATIWMHQGVDRQSFFAVAGRSAELQALNKLLQQGSELKNIECAEPAFFDPDFL